MNNFSVSKIMSRSSVDMYITPLSLAIFAGVDLSESGQGVSYISGSPCKVYIHIPLPLNRDTLIIPTPSECPPLLLICVYLLYYNYVCIFTGVKRPAPPRFVQRDQVTFRIDLVTFRVTY